MTTRIARQPTSSRTPAVTAPPTSNPAMPAETAAAPATEGNGASSPALPGHASRDAAAFAARGQAPTDAVNPLNARLKAVRASAGTHASETEVSSRTGAAERGLDGSALGLSTPGSVSAPVADTADARTVDKGRRGVSVTDTRVDGAGSRSVSGGIHRAALDVSITRTGGGTSTGGGVSVENGLAMLSGDFTWTQREGGAARVGGWVGGWKDDLYAGGSASRTDAQGRTQRISGWAGGVASREVTDLGTVDAEGTHKGMRKVQYDRALQGYVNAGLGMASAGVLGVGGALTLVKGSAITFRTHVTQDKAAELLHDEHGLKRAVSDRARAVGLKEEPVTLPDLSRPETLKAGDELVLTTTGRVTLGLAVGASGVTVGALGTVHGTFEMAARRVDDKRIELCVTPMDIKGMQLTAGLPLVADVRAGKAAGAALRQAFVFDVSTPAGRAAYDAAVAGTMPGALQEVKDVKGQPAEALRGLLEQEKLPEGVTRTHLARLETTRTRAGFGLNYGPVQEGGWAGLSWHRVKSREGAETVGRDGVYAETTRGVETRREVLLSGVETAGVFGSLRQVSTYAEDGTPTRHFDGLTLKARFEDSRVRGLELNDEVLDLVNRTLGTSYDLFTREGRNHSRSIVLERTLDAGALEKLAGSRDAIMGAADAVGIRGSVAEKFAADLAAATDPGARAELVQAWVADEGLRGLGAVSRALGGVPELQTESSAYSRATDKAREFTLRFREPVKAADDKGTVERFDLVGKALTDAAEGLMDLPADPLLTAAEKATLGTQLQDAVKQLSSLLRLDHLSAPERKAMFDRLDGGWTTGAEARVMNALKEAGL